MRLYADKSKVVYVGFNLKDEPVYVGRGSLKRADDLMYHTKSHSVKTDEEFSIEYVDIYGPFSIEESIEKEKELVEYYRYDYSLYNVKLNCYNSNRNRSIVPSTDLGLSILKDLQECKMTQSEIARKHGVSRQRVSQIKQKFT